MTELLALGVTAWIIFAATVCVATVSIFVVVLRSFRRHDEHMDKRLGGRW